MSGPWLPTRRGIAGLIAGAAASFASSALAVEPEPPAPPGGDAPAEPVKQRPLRDRGIGGTGMIGTIRRFGSIVVNDRRIAYPRTAAVWIDGRRTRAAALRIGHVVQLVAEPREGGLATSAIIVTSEVVGPVQALSPATLTVLGQTVLLDGLRLRGRALRPGDVVAVSGLRHLDGSIAASLIERRRRGRLQVAGPVVADGQGALRIGGLVLAGAPQTLAGRRAVVTGRLVAGQFRVAASRIDPGLMDDAALSGLEIEAYLVRAGGRLVFGSGLTIPDQPDAAIPTTGEAYVIAAFRRDASGVFDLSSVRSPPEGPRGPRPSGPPPGGPGPPGGRPGGPGGRADPGGPGGPAFHR